MEQVYPPPCLIGIPSAHGASTKTRAGEMLGGNAKAVGEEGDGAKAGGELRDDASVVGE